MIHLTIGPINLAIEGINKEQLPENTILFLSDNEQVDIHYQIEIGGTVPSFPEKVLYRKNDIIVFQKNDKLESRLLFVPNVEFPYAYYEELDEQHVHVSFNPYFNELFSSDTIFHSLLALERHLWKYDAFVLHCSYMDFEGKAYLFSGPSGIGKTTHTDLWCKQFPNTAKVLNGDKCLLIKEGTTYYAVGWPICGSSKICHNEKREVAAIILLQQAPTNYEISEKRIRHFKQILEQLAVNYWNASFVNKAMSFAEQLSGALPCCTYACNMEEDAVSTLYTILQEKQHEKK